MYQRVCVSEESFQTKTEREISPVFPPVEVTEKGTLDQGYLLGLRCRIIAL